MKNPLKNSVLVSFFLLSACTTTVPDTTNLKPDEGLLVVGLDCEAFMRLDVFESGKGPKAKAFGSVLTDFNAMTTRATFIPCLEGELKTKPLKEGNYYIGATAAYGAIMTIDEKNAYKFSIEKQKLNYVGNLKGKKRFSKKIRNTTTHTISLNFTDDREKNMQKLKTEFPNLFSRYEYVVDIAEK